MSQLPLTENQQPADSAPPACETIRFVSPEAAEQIVKLLEEEPKLNQKLVDAFVRHRELIG